MKTSTFLRISRLNIGRILIGVVVFINLQCALLFLLFPSTYAPAFELSGIPGENVISSLGILFVMWNIPYLFALVHPKKYRVSLIQAILMQTVGFVGESILWINIEPAYSIMKSSLFRFMVFDGGGLLLLLAAIILVKRDS